MVLSLLEMRDDVLFTRGFFAACVARLPEALLMYCRSSEDRLTATPCAAMLFFSPRRTFGLDSPVFVAEIGAT